MTCSAVFVYQTLAVVCYDPEGKEIPGVVRPGLILAANELTPQNA